MVNRCSDRLSYAAQATGPLLIRMGGRSLVHPPNPVDNLRPLRRFVTALAFYLTGLRACQDGEPLLRPVIVSCTCDGPAHKRVGGRKFGCSLLLIPARWPGRLEYSA